MDAAAAAGQGADLDAVGTAMTERLLRLPTRCPDCERRPPIRIDASLVDMARALPADATALSWVCRCGVLHRVPASDVLRAA